MSVAKGFAASFVDISAATWVCSVAIWKFPLVFASESPCARLRGGLNVALISRPCIDETCWKEIHAVVKPKMSYVTCLGERKSDDSLFACL
jgi:hypothetical protein